MCGISRKGLVDVFLRKYEEWLRGSLNIAEWLASEGKAANALDSLVDSAERLDLKKEITSELGGAISGLKKRLSAPRSCSTRALLRTRGAPVKILLKYI